jgi:DNA polymerase-3 subunit gamma/tau
VSYLVLARKYRPQSFQDLVGQEHVARTLANAIGSGRVAHAFLFTGVRGVGKTTSARLLAKCLNCLGADGKATGPTATPCQTCAACTEIAAGNDMDVQEIDGASYNGVDEVRRLQEGLAFRPARDRYKIYIVDEVHMLSNAAWNAFLKTLEEPPPHVKFIFATTEVHKVPVTILSRCQRYDFKLIATQMIAARLKEVLGQESITADDTAISVIAREAAGSMRDAMSLLDQVIAFSGNTLTGDDVARVLGVADRKILHQLGSALVSGDAPAALSVVDGLAAQGFDLPHVARDVMRHLRNLVVAKVCGEDGRQLLDLADEEVRDVMELAKSSDADDLTRLFQGFSKGFDEMVKSGQPRAALEMLLVRLARRPPLLPLDELLSRLGELERRLGGAAPSPPRGGGGGGGRSVPTSPSISSAMPSLEPVRGGGFTDGAVALAMPAPVREVVSARAPELAARPRLVQSAPQPVFEAPRFQPEFVPPAAPSRPQEITPQPPSVTRKAEPATPAASGGASPASPERGRNQAAFQMPAAIEVPEPTPELLLWKEIVDRVRAERAPLAAMLEHALPLEVGDARIRIALDEFLASQLREPDALNLVTRVSKTAALQVDEKTLAQLSAPTLASIDRDRRRAQIAKARVAVAEHPLVKETIRLFNAELRDVRLPEGSSDG